MFRSYFFTKFRISRFREFFPPRVFNATDEGVPLEFGIGARGLKSLNYGRQPPSQPRRRSIYRAYYVAWVKTQLMTTSVYY